MPEIIPKNLVTLRFLKFLYQVLTSTCKMFQMRYWPNFYVDPTYSNAYLFNLEKWRVYLQATVVLPIHRNCLFIRLMGGLFQWKIYDSFILCSWIIYLCEILAFVSPEKNMSSCKRSVFWNHTSSRALCSFFVAIKP